MSTSDQAVSVDGLDHVAHVDDLDLVNDAALADPLQTQRGAVTKGSQELSGSSPLPSPIPHLIPNTHYWLGGGDAFVVDSQSTINQFASTRLTLMKA